MAKAPPCAGMEELLMKATFPEVWVLVKCPDTKLWSTRIKLDRDRVFCGIHTSKRQSGREGLQMQVLLLVGGEDYLLRSKIYTSQVLNCHSLLKNKNKKGITLCVTETTCQ